jgi:hypothetical protein
VAGVELSTDEAFLYGFLDSSPMYFYQINAPVIRNSPCHSVPKGGADYLPEKSIVFKLNNKIRNDRRLPRG